MGKTTEMPTEETAQAAPTVAELEKALGQLRLEAEEQQLDNCKLKRYIGELEEKLNEATSAHDITGLITGVPEDDAAAVVQAFRHFLKVYFLFKKEHNLAHTYDDAKDMTLGFIAKTGIVARLVKHEQRNDPKPDHAFELEKALMGTLAYLTVIGARYKLPFDAGMKAELLSALDQHAGSETQVAPEAGS